MNSLQFKCNLNYFNLFIGRYFKLNDMYRYRYIDISTYRYMHIKKCIHL